MSATPSEVRSLRGFSHLGARSAQETEPRPWKARSTLMFLVGATGLFWAGVIYVAIRFL